MKQKESEASQQQGPLDLYFLGQNIFFAGDCRRGASLVVTAIAEGRDVANRIDEYLQARDLLPLGLANLNNHNLLSTVSTSTVS